ncbi:hypothetical protein ACA910_009501 [Epithemia clementina (nom. ined.)]
MRNKSSFTESMTTKPKVLAGKATRPKTKAIRATTTARKATVESTNVKEKKAKHSVRQPLPVTTDDDRDVILSEKPSTKNKGSAANHIDIEARSFSVGDFNEDYCDLLQSQRPSPSDTTENDDNDTRAESTLSWNHGRQNSHTSVAAERRSPSPTTSHMEDRVASDEARYASPPRQRSRSPLKATVPTKEKSSQPPPRQRSNGNSPGVTKTRRSLDKPRRHGNESSLTSADEARNNSPLPSRRRKDGASGAAKDQTSLVSREAWGKARQLDGNGNVLQHQTSSSRSHRLHDGDDAIGARNPSPVPLVRNRDSFVSLASARGHSSPSRRIISPEPVEDRDAPPSRQRSNYIFTAMRSITNTCAPSVISRKNNEDANGYYRRGRSAAGSVMIITHDSPTKSRWKRSSPSPTRRRSKPPYGPEPKNQAEEEEVELKISVIPSPPRVDGYSKHNMKISTSPRNDSIVGSTTNDDYSLSAHSNLHFAADAGIHEEAIRTTTDLDSISLEYSRGESPIRSDRNNHLSTIHTPVAAAADNSKQNRKSTRSHPFKSIASSREDYKLGRGQKNRRMADKKSKHGNKRDESININNDSGIRSHEHQSKNRQQHNSTRIDTVSQRSRVTGKTDTSARSRNSRERDHTFQSMPEDGAEESYEARDEVDEDQLDNLSNRNIGKSMSSISALETIVTDGENSDMNVAILVEHCENRRGKGRQEGQERSPSPNCNDSVELVNFHTRIIQNTSSFQMALDKEDFGQALARLNSDITGSQSEFLPMVKEEEFHDHELGDGQYDQINKEHVQRRKRKGRRIFSRKPRLHVEPTQGKSKRHGDVNRRKSHRPENEYNNLAREDDISQKGEEELITRHVGEEELACCLEQEKGKDEHNDNKEEGEVEVSIQMSSTNEVNLDISLDSIDTVSTADDLDSTTVLPNTSSVLDDVTNPTSSGIANSTTNSHKRQPEYHHPQTNCGMCLSDLCFLPLTVGESMGIMNKKNGSTQDDSDNISVTTPVDADFFELALSDYVQGMVLSIVDQPEERKFRRKVVDDKNEADNVERERKAKEEEKSQSSTTTSSDTISSKFSSPQVVLDVEYENSNDNNRIFKSSSGHYKSRKASSDPVLPQSISFHRNSSSAMSSSDEDVGEDAVPAEPVVTQRGTRIKRAFSQQWQRLAVAKALQKKTEI